MAAQDYEQVTYNSPAGAMIGQSATEKIGFFGITPAIQPTNAAQAALTATTAVSSGFGFTTSANFAAMLAQLENIRASLVTLGLLKGS
jgi:hypothetical protein